MTHRYSRPVPLHHRSITLSHLTKIASLLALAAFGYLWLTWLAERDAEALQLARCGAAESRDQYHLCLQDLSRSTVPR